MSSEDCPHVDNGIQGRAEMINGDFIGKRPDVLHAPTAAHEVLKSAKDVGVPGINLRIPSGLVMSVVESVSSYMAKLLRSVKQENRFATPDKSCH